MQYEKKNTCKINTVIQIAARQKNWLLATKARGKFQAYDKMKTVKKKKEIIFENKFNPHSFSLRNIRERDRLIHSRVTYLKLLYLSFKIDSLNTRMTVFPIFLFQPYSLQKYPHKEREKDMHTS